MVSVTDTRETNVTVSVSLTLVREGLARVVVVVTEVSGVAVSVVPASAFMRASVADRSWILAVEIAVMTPRTASIVSATVSTTIVAVVVVLIADDVISGALGVLNTGGGLTEVIAALVAVRAVVGVDTASFTQSGVTVGAVLWVVGRGQVTQPVEVVAVLV